MGGRRRRINGRRIAGLAMFCCGVGMLAAMLIPAWCLIFAVFLVAVGAWHLFFC